MFTGVFGLEVGTAPEIDLGHGFRLATPNNKFLSARSRYSMNEVEYWEAENVSHFFVYVHEPVFPVKSKDAIKSIFLNGVMSSQALKPVHTTGFLFYGDALPGGGFHLQHVERRPPMEPGPWALARKFDQQLLVGVPGLIADIQEFVSASNAEPRNALILLHLGLEHFHPLVGGLLWVMGLEALFDSQGRNDFKNKLCECLGSSERAFPAWSSGQPAYTVEDVAIDLYMLRNKIAHGVDVRKAASDATSPVDLLQKHTLPSSESVEYALILSEAACYLLCQVLRKKIS
jgi:hypothetical protein